MVESIGRLCGRIVKRPLVPLMVVIVGAHAPGDPARRGTGYGGVLPVPGPSVPPPATALIIPAVAAVIARITPWVTVICER